MDCCSRSRVTVAAASISERNRMYRLFKADQMLGNSMQNIHELRTVMLITWMHIKRKESKMKIRTERPWATNGRRWQWQEHTGGDVRHQCAAVGGYPPVTRSGHGDRQDHGKPTVADCKGDIVSNDERQGKGHSQVARVQTRSKVKGSEHAKLVGWPQPHHGSFLAVHLV
ncbi:uncharacterized protein LAESUDRAFT_752559 [Laetiporus sulphureus 93-53]|uniref:Uncharacterized protein n=1 Tax=Laetiporus sulphureus 93-53 TaxID=1314785 RepID=A0A165BT73_9APHY|nr:uncharacterized protein LAESUDRAFT_752559 [Laetiporus sulphureus 93-53]KZT01605.1 hypothetical protein LAESUDRAFT_752559 [Laetiporus sulphureus 93-53]